MAFLSVITWDKQIHFLRINPFIHLSFTTFFEYETHIPYISIDSASKIVEDSHKEIVGFTTVDRRLLKTVLCKLLKSVLYIQYLLIHYLY